MNDKSAGFTLIELMVVVAIVGILAMIAYPSYQDIVRKSNRADGLSSLMKMMGNQTRFFSETNTYTADLTDLGYATATNAPSTEGKYRITATACAGGITSCVILTARAQGDQANDISNGISCDPLTLNSTDAKTPAACW